MLEVYLPAWGTVYTDWNEDHRFAGKVSSIETLPV